MNKTKHLCFSSICRSGVVALGLAAILGAAIGGCDDPVDQAKKATTKPIPTMATSEPVEPVATVAAYPMKPPSVICIDGRNINFPAAKLAVIDRKSGGYTLRLCSDDPPDAIDPGYRGNNFVLDMRMSIDRLSDLPNASWDRKPGDSDDGTSGIYLQGYREQYRVSDAHVAFARNGDEMLVIINGTFLHNDPTNPATPPTRAAIMAQLHTNLPE